LDHKERIEKYREEKREEVKSFSKQYNDEAGLKRKLEDGYNRNINNFKAQLASNYELSRTSIKSKYDQKRSTDRVLLKNKQKDQIEQIKAVEEKRINQEKAIIDTELKTNYNKPLIELHNKLNEEVADYKKELEREVVENENKYLRVKADKIEQIKNKYNKLMEDINQQYEEQLKEDIKLIENTQKKDYETTIEELREQLRYEEEREQEEMDKRLLQGKIECDIKCEKRMNALELDFNKLIEKELKNIKGGSNAIEKIIKEKEIELKRSKTTCDKLLNEITSLSKKYLDQKDVNAASNEVEELKLELKSKEKELEECVETVELINSNTQLKKLKEDIKDIKQGIINLKQKKKNPYKQKSLKLELDKIKHILNKPTSINEEISDIRLFIVNERKELQDTRADFKSNYELLSKLLKDLEEQRRECRKDLTKTAFDSIRKISLKSLKDKYDLQIELMTKEINKVRIQIINIEKRMSFIGMIENHIKFSDCNSFNKIRSEYKTYMEKYKDSNNQDDTSIVDSLSDIEQPMNDEEMLSEVKSILKGVNSSHKAFNNKKVSDMRRTTRTIPDTATNFYTQRFLKTMNDRSCKTFTPKANNVLGLFEDETIWLSQIRSSIRKNI